MWQGTPPPHSTFVPQKTPVSLFRVPIGCIDLCSVLPGTEISWGPFGEVEEVVGGWGSPVGPPRPLSCPQDTKSSLTALHLAVRGGNLALAHLLLRQPGMAPRLVNMKV